MEDEVKNEEFEEKTDKKPAKSKKVSNDQPSISLNDFSLWSTIGSFALLFLAHVFVLFNVGGLIVFAIFFILGMLAVGFSLVVQVINFKKEGKMTFTVEIILTMLAIFLWFSSMTIFLV